MDDYCFRKIKSTALVMIAIVAIHIALSFPLGYYWNALQARLSGIEFSPAGSSGTAMTSQGFAIYVLFFGAIAAVAFITSPRRTSIWWRLIFIVPLFVYGFSAYVEYQNLYPIQDKFRDIYASLDYIAIIPYLAVAGITALYYLFVITIPSLRFTQAFGWVVVVVAILSYLFDAVFVVYGHTMNILVGTFGESAFYTYLIAFVLDVVSYFFMVSVLMTYCMIKREERWDRLEAIAIETGIDYDEAMDMALYVREEPSTYLSERVIPDIEDLKEHEFSDTIGLESYLIEERRINDEKRREMKKLIAEELRREAKAEFAAREAKRVAEEKSVAKSPVGKAGRASAERSGPKLPTSKTSRTPADGMSIKPSASKTERVLPEKPISKSLKSADEAVGAGTAGSAEAKVRTSSSRRNTSRRRKRDPGRTTP